MIDTWESNYLQNLVFADHITEDDIKYLAVPVLRHRIIPNYAAEAQGLSSVDIIDKILNTL